MLDARPRNHLSLYRLPWWQDQAPRVHGGATHLLHGLFSQPGGESTWDGEPLAPHRVWLPSPCSGGHPAPPSTAQGTSRRQISPGRAPRSPLSQVCRRSSSNRPRIAAGARVVPTCLAGRSLPKEFLTAWEHYTAPGQTSRSALTRSVICERPVGICSLYPKPLATRPPPPSPGPPAL